MESQLEADYDMDTDQYLRLFSVYNAASAGMPFLFGILGDKIGPSRAATLSALINLIGSLMVALSTASKSYPLLFLGRLVFGISGEACTCLNDTVIGKWFRSSMMSTAYAVTLTVSRLASIVTMWVSPRITDLQDGNTSDALWLSALVSVCGLGGALGMLRVDGWGDAYKSLWRRGGGSAAMVSMDTDGDRDMVAEGVTGGEEGGTKEVTKKTATLRELLSLPIEIYACALGISAYYGGSFPFIKIAAGLLTWKYGYDQTKASTYASMILVVSMISAPFLGPMIDRLGHRPLIFMAAPVTSIVAYLLIGYAPASELLPPSVLLGVIGVGISVCASTLWSCVPLVCEPDRLGTAIGITCCLQNLSMMCVTLVLGWILGEDEDNYPASCLCLMVCNGVALLAGAYIMSVDKRHLLGLLATPAAKTRARIDALMVHRRGMARGVVPPRLTV
ncbi:major facilitator superfamily protein, partial [Kipferlia bialata]|eukprot:g8467.t1